MAVVMLRHILLFSLMATPACDILMNDQIHTETFVRTAADAGLDCFSVCRTAILSEDDEDVVGCEEAFNEDGDEVVVCAFEWIQETHV